VAEPPGEDELREAVARLRVGDLLAQTLVSVVSIGFAKLEPGDTRDLEQARVAIEAVRALMPIIEGGADDELLRDLEAARSSLQLAYVRAVAQDRPEDEQPG
jgi:hypothetical protein